MQLLVRDSAYSTAVDGEMHHASCKRLATQIQWQCPDLEVGAQRVWGTEVPQRGPEAEPLVGGLGGIASRKLIAVIKDIWKPNHAQFCVFSSTAQPGIFL